MVHLHRLDKTATTQQLRDFLGGFDFRGDKVDAEVATFSGGEKARLALAMITFERPNLLLMDEPTNHLDIEMRQALTVALQEFAGAIVLISHDRHLLANTVDSFLLVEDGRVEEFDGDLADYRERLLGASAAQPAASREHKATTKTSRKNAFRENRQLQSRLKTLESRLERLQRKRREVDEQLADAALYQNNRDADLQGLLREQLSLKEQIEEVEETWLATSEAIEAQV
jgi:ATP-binding cassette subfamily F protein 3